jgi:hypothetical protein
MSLPSILKMPDANLSGAGMIFRRLERLRKLAFAAISELSFTR